MQAHLLTLALNGPTLLLHTPQTIPICHILRGVKEKHDIPLMSRHVNPLAAAYLRLGLRSEAANLINNHLKDRIPPPPPPSPRKKINRWKDTREPTFDNPGFEGVPLVDWSDDDDASANLLVGLDDGISDDSDDEDENDDDFSDGYEAMQLNIHQVQSKDRASHSLLVKGAVMEGDWAGAVRELQRMTEVGFYPNSRNLNSWSEGMERGCRPAGNGVNSGDSDCNAGYHYLGRQRKRSWKKKRDSIWLENLN